ncbi:AfsR/SARP family transcriptional regulator, partial [Streptomyces sp. SID6137]|nr:transcriptional regulator [Streptomyces sp. SID6137]
MSAPPTANASPMTPGPAEPFLSVLGPMSARRDGRELPLGPPRRRTLLALLLIRLGRVVPTELLVEELWGDGAPRHAVATLQSHVSHLRRTLDTAETGQLSVLRHRTPGYVLELDPEHVDACRFERLVTDGRRLLEQHDPRTAHARFTEALGLWRDSPYAEFDGHPPLSDECARLEQIRLTAVESCAEARLVLGAAEEVAADLDGEARRHPTRERLVGHLMTALSRLGRQAEALEVYERTRSHLVEEFGVDTAAELREVRNAILRQEPGASTPSGKLSPEQIAVSVAAPAPEEALAGGTLSDGAGLAGLSGLSGAERAGGGTITTLTHEEAATAEGTGGAGEPGKAAAYEESSAAGRADLPPGVRTNSVEPRSGTARRPVPTAEDESAAAQQAGGFPECASGWTAAAPSPFTGRG